MEKRPEPGPGSGDTMEVRMITPYLVVDRVPELLAFLIAAFGAKELIRVDRPDGSVQHAEVKLGS